MWISRIDAETKILLVLLLQIGNGIILWFKIQSTKIEPAEFDAAGVCARSPPSELLVCCCVSTTSAVFVDSFSSAAFAFSTASSLGAFFCVDDTAPCRMFPPCLRVVYKRNEKSMANRVELMETTFVRVFAGGLIVLVSSLFPSVEFKRINLVRPK
jgi:hypothetical protein